MDYVESSTQSKKKPSVFGGACVIACVCVGAGMLGLPAAGAGLMDRVVRCCAFPNDVDYVCEWLLTLRSTERLSLPIVFFYSNQRFIGQAY